MSERYDAAVIGTGPAGLEAAVTLKIRNKSVLLLGSRELSRKVGKAEAIRNYLGFPEISGADLARHFHEHLDSAGIRITEDQVTNLYPMGDAFSLLTRTNTIYEASAVIIATGVNFGKPYEGEKEFLGRGVSYCATCDAPLYKGKTCAVIASSAAEEEEADFLDEIAGKVYYIPLYPEIRSLRSGIEVIREKPLAIRGTIKAETLVLENRELHVDGTFILRDAVAPDTLFPEIKMSGRHIETDRSMATNIPGLFACGDITGQPYQYIKAAGEGNVAALSAVSYLASLKNRQ